MDCTKKGEGLRVSSPTRVLDLIESLGGLYQAGGGEGVRVRLGRPSGAPLGTFPIPNVGIGSG